MSATSLRSGGGAGARGRRTSPSSAPGPCGLACGRELAPARPRGLGALRARGRRRRPRRRPSSIRPASPGTRAATSSSATSASSTACSTRRSATTSTSTSARRTSASTAAGCRTRSRTTSATSSPEDAYECLLGLIEAPGGRRRRRTSRPGWRRRSARASRATSCARTTSKVWATPPEQMSATWIAERVSVVDYKRALRSVLLGLDDVGWGPNNTFRFPRSGGTGEIYRRARRPARRRACTTTRELVGLDAERRGAPLRRRPRREDYDALVSTMPIDRLVAAIDDCPADVREAAAALEHNGVWVVGVGYERAARRRPLVALLRRPGGARSTASRTSPSTPPRTSPGGDTERYSSYMTETAYSTHRPREPRAGSRSAVVDGLVATGLDRRTTCRSRRCTRSTSSTPIRSRRSSATRRSRSIQPWLMERDDLLARPLRLVALRDRQHGPRREDGHRRRAPPRRGPPGGALALLSPRRR